MIRYLTVVIFLFSITLIRGQHIGTLIPNGSYTHIAVQDGDWFDTLTWASNKVPSNAAIVHIPMGKRVTYEGNNSDHIFAIKVDGDLTVKQSNSGQKTTLIFDTFIGTMMSHVKFLADSLQHGAIDVIIKPFDIEKHKAGLSGYSQIWNSTALSHFSDGLPVDSVVKIVGPDKRFNTLADALAGNTVVTEVHRSPKDDGAGVLGRYGWDSTQLSLGIVTMGQLEIIGKEKVNMLKLAQDAAKGQKKIVLDSVPSSWEIGDKVLVTRGGDWRTTNKGNDTATINNIIGDTIFCKKNLKKNHLGRPQDSLHCYIGNLTRNIVFKSTVKDTIHQRGHLMAMHNDSNVQIRNAAFIDMGRTDKSVILDDLIWDGWVQPPTFYSKISALGQECTEHVRNPAKDITNSRGRYSIHLHKLKAKVTSNLAQVTGNVVWGNPGWGITHHDSYANVSNNIVYQVTGSGIVSESGSELGFWDNNLVVDIDKGHKEDVYTSALFHDDYLFSGQGMGMKGRGVVCRGNVIADVIQGFGVMNMNPTKTHDRVDPTALATLRPGFLVDQFPLSKNGYSIEGDGVMPVEVALILENNTVIWSNIALKSIERDMGVNHESRSIFDGFSAWGTNEGLVITYQADYSFKDVFISGKDTASSKGIYLWKHSHNHIFDGIKLVDLAYGMTPSKLVESNTSSLLKTRNNGFTPWYFIDLVQENVDKFYNIEKEDTSTATSYTEHTDNPIHISSSEVVARPITFTIKDSSLLEVDYSTNDFRFEIDGFIGDDLGAYELGIQQALAQGNLREGYPTRIYEFASDTAFESYLIANGVYKDTADNDQLYFILEEVLPNRVSYQFKTFPIRVKINNAPNKPLFNNAQIEPIENFAPTNQLVSYSASVSQSSTDTTIIVDGIKIDAGAWKANDGNTNGRINCQLYQRGLVPLGSFSSTEREYQPWYDLDLGELKTIEFIDVWNTVELNGADIEINSSHFDDFYVLVSDTAFDTLSLAQAINLADYQYLYNGSAKRKLSLNNLGVKGRYVRIQAMDTTIMKLAEVEIVGRKFIDSCVETHSIDILLVCDSITWRNGITYYADNNSATDTILNAGGCDSIIHLDLTVITNDTNITVNGLQLTANQGGVGYQWLDCGNSFVPIFGENNQLLTVSSNGIYAVELNNNGCIDTTECIQINSIGINSLNNGSIQIYPNPNTGNFKLIYSNISDPGTVKIITKQGKLLAEYNKDYKSSRNIDVKLESGIYYVMFESNKGLVYQRKLVILN